MPTGIPQTSFTQGEIAPSLYGRIDFEGYYKGLRTCRNFIVSKYGGVDNRPGTQFVVGVDDSTQLHRLLPFQFNSQQQYILVLGNYTMEIIANGVQLNVATPYNVTGYSLGSLYLSGSNPQIDLTLTVPTHPFSTGDSLVITGVSVAANGLQLISKVDANSIKITFIGLSAALNALRSTWSGGGTAQESVDSVLTVATPWPSSVLFQLKYTQSADVLTVCHPNYSTMQIERLAETLWQVVAFPNTSGPFQDINVDNSIVVYASAFTGFVTLTASKTLFSSDMVNLEFYLEQSPDNTTPAWEVSKAVTFNDIVIYGDNYYQAQNSGTTGTVPPTVTIGSQRDGMAADGILWNYLHSGFGIVTITAFTDSTHVNGTVTSRLPDSVVGGSASIAITNVKSGTPDPLKDIIVSVSSPLSPAFISGSQVLIAGVTGAIANAVNGTSTITVIDSLNFYLNNNTAEGTYTGGGLASSTAVATPTYFWALPAWGMTAQGFPSTTSYFQDRQLFGGTNGQPSNVWFSTTAGFNDFSVGDPVLDSDAITYKILSNQVNQIKHMMELTYLLIFTSGGVYMTQGGQNNNGTITPSTISLAFQGANAIGDIPPLRINNYAVFVQELGSKVRTLGYSFAENAFIGQDVTTMSNHLFKFNKIVDWCYQEIPYSCVWCVRDDGVLIGFTFNPEQQITAWHRHDTQGAFESVCCVTENNQNVLYAIVNRTLNGVVTRCIERFAPRQFSDPSYAYFVDCGWTFGILPTDTPQTVFGGGYLDHLNGQTVSILADGIVYPQQVVVGGSVSIPNPAQVVHVGLPYTSDFETLDISSMRADIRDKKKAINAVSLIVDQSSGFMVGPDTDSLVEVTQRRTENYGAATDLISGILDENIPCGWDKKGRIFVRQDNPLPVSILAIIPQAEVGGY